MKYILLFLLGICMNISSHAQTISRYVIPATGGEYNSPQLQVSYTIGEPITKTVSNGSFILTQGFQQPDSLVAITLHLTCFIQGYYLWNGEMQPALYNQGVSNDPYLTDSVEIQILASTPPYQVVQSTQALLHTNGSMTCKLNPSLFGQAYYIALKHRNAVKTWSAAPVTIGSGVTTYDFTTAANKAYGNNQWQVANGVWAIYSGDITQDDAVDASDYMLLDPDITLGNDGYLATDLNGDGVVDAFDYFILQPNIQQGIGIQNP